MQKSLSQTVYDLTKKYRGKVDLISYPVDFVGITGSISGAMLLWYLVECSESSSDPDGWFYKSYSEIEKRFSMSYHQVSYCTNKLKNMGVLTIDVTKNPSDDRFTRRYKINTETLNQLLDKYLSNTK